MSRISEAADRLCAKGIVAIVRAKSSGQLIDVAKALLAGGVDCIEITMTTPNALEVIGLCRREVPGAFIGVGSVTSPETVKEAVSAGAQYVVCPVFRREVVVACHACDVPVMPGAFTPTEIFEAAAAGADIVKVFPAGSVGPEYFKAVLAPMPTLKLAPTGGVDLTTAAAWIKAGAASLGVGSSLVSKEILASGDFGKLRELAGQYVKIVSEARAGKK
jgi:2-dehydro-3-deoxyphosphogluconate aldolase/(4S)-4-hydroxy-2-oxoglutarate aldolase